MGCLENELHEYNQLKCELFRICNCIDYCINVNKEFYQNAAIIYSTEIKRLEQLFFDKYGMKLKGIVSCYSPINNQK